MIAFLLEMQEIHITPPSASFPVAAQQDETGWKDSPLANDRKKRIITDVELASGNPYCPIGLDIYRLLLKMVKRWF